MDGVKMNELGVSVYIYILFLSLCCCQARSGRRGWATAELPTTAAYHDLDHLSPLLLRPSEKRPNELLRAGDDERLLEREFLENELS